MSRPTLAIAASEQDIAASQQSTKKLGFPNQLAKGVRILLNSSVDRKAVESSKESHSPKKETGTNPV